MTDSLIRQNEGTHLRKKKMAGTSDEFEKGVWVHQDTALTRKEREGKGKERD